MGSSNTTERLFYIDFLKFIGLTGIFVAHVGAPNWAIMLRSFDVPLMVFLSSVLAQRSYDRYISSGLTAKDYCFSRIQRLVYPTWFFLVLYFLLCFIMDKQAYGIKYYVDSFLLTRYGIGYVWIVLIYLYSAVLVPLFYNKSPSGSDAIVICLVYVLYELAYHYQIGIRYKVIETTFYYIIPYGIITYLGYHYSGFSSRTKYSVTILSGVTFIVLIVYYLLETGTFQSVSAYKYPPRLYYLSYGIASVFLLMLLCERYRFRIFRNRIILFISSHSMWIYLWHILVLKLYEKSHLPKTWYIKLVIVYAVSVFQVMLVNKCLDYLEKRHHYTFLRYLRG